jgi:hypothetical protein
MNSVAIISDRQSCTRRVGLDDTASDMYSEGSQF